jgi:hypothetical protein
MLINGGQGKRIVEDKDYTTKAEAAAELSKFRKETGETRTLDEIKRLITQGEEADKKNKSDAQLLKEELDKLKLQVETKDATIKKVQYENTKRDVRDYFSSAMKKENLPVIPQILEEFIVPFYEKDGNKIGKEQYDKEVFEAITAAREKQAISMQELGITSQAQPDAFSATGAGIGNSGVPGGSQNTEEILRSSSWTPGRLPFIPEGTPPPKT